MRSWVNAMGLYDHWNDDGEDEDAEDRERDDINQED